MTIIIAVRESESSLLLASDSQETDSQGVKRTKSSKLRSRDGASLIWATSGNGTLGERFDNWMGHMPWPPESWDIFRDQAAQVVAKLNGQQRSLAQEARVQWNSGYGMDALVLGWIGTEPQLLEFTDDGQHTSYLAERFRAIGSAARGATAAWVVLNDFIPDSRLRLAKVIATMADMDMMCGRPICALAVTPERMEEVNLEQIKGGM